METAARCQHTILQLQPEASSMNELQLNKVSVPAVVGHISCFPSTNENKDLLCITEEI